MSMYKGTNNTALQSRDWLASAMIDLMKSKPYEKITIQNLCDHAQLSRQTFYNIFDSKDEVLHFCLQKMCIEQFGQLDQSKAPSVKEIINVYISFLNKNKDFLITMLQNRLDGIILMALTKAITLYAEKWVKKDDLFPYSVAMLSGALAQLQLYCFQQKQLLSPTVITRLLDGFFNGTLYDISSD